MRKKKTFGSLAREYRILVIALVFFGTGLFFFISNGGGENHPKEVLPARREVASPPAISNPIFSKYPSPEKFASFSYGENGLNGREVLRIYATCQDAYLAILVFPAKFDYRVDPTKAAINASTPCGSGKNFSSELNGSSLKNFPFGEYYYFVADQGERGLWYNPR